MNILNILNATFKQIQKMQTYLTLMLLIWELTQPQPLFNYIIVIYKIVLYQNGLANLLLLLIDIVINP